MLQVYLCSHHSYVGVTDESRNSAVWHLQCSACNGRRSYQGCAHEKQPDTSLLIFEALERGKLETSRMEDWGESRLS